MLSFHFYAMTERVSGMVLKSAANIFIKGRGHKKQVIRESCRLKKPSIKVPGWDFTRAPNGQRSVYIIFKCTLKTRNPSKIAITTPYSLN